jgi:hypothetical protein
VCPEVVALVWSQVREVVDQHLALLTQGAGDQADSRALGDVLGHRHAAADRLVVGMRMDQHEPTSGLGRHIRSHGPTLCGARWSLGRLTAIGESAHAMITRGSAK